MPSLLEHMTEDHSGARSTKSWINKPSKRKLSRMMMHSALQRDELTNFQNPRSSYNILFALHHRYIHINCVHRYFFKAQIKLCCSRKTEVLADMEQQWTTRPAVHTELMLNPDHVILSNCPVLSQFLTGLMFLHEPSWKYSAKLVGS